MPPAHQCPFTAEKVAMRFRLSALSLVATLTFASPLSAATLTSASPLGSTSRFTFLNGGTVTAFGYYVGGYNGQVGVAPTQTSVVLNCVDFFHEVYAGQQWDANVSSLGSGSGVGYFTRESDIDLYKQAAWLTVQYAGKSDYNVGQIQATIWNLFKPASVTPASNYWLLAAQNNYKSMDYSGYYVVTDVNKSNPNSVQEFITTGNLQTTATPEPASMLLLGSGLAGLAGVSARRKKENRG